MNTSTQPLLEAVRCRAESRRRRQPLERLRDLVNTDSWRRERFIQALSAPGLAIIGEVYRQSPAGGVLLREEARAGTNPARQPIPGPRWHALVDGLRSGGAAAIAVWTEEDAYGCTLEDLLTVGHARLPRLRRDFVLDEGMILEALNYGADAIELRADTLEDGPLASLHAIVRELGAASVLRAEGPEELRRVLACEPDYVLLAGRSEWEALAALLPAGKPFLLEDSVRERADLELAARLGAKAVLIGEPLIRSADPAALLQSLRG
jgi:indole-3-glycerol phosphate synthase